MGLIQRQPLALILSPVPVKSPKIWEEQGMDTTLCSTWYYIEYIIVFSSTTEHGGLVWKQNNIRIDLKGLLHEPVHQIQAGVTLTLLA